MIKVYHAIHPPDYQLRAFYEMLFKELPEIEMELSCDNSIFIPDVLVDNQPLLLFPAADYQLPPPPPPKPPPENPPPEKLPPPPLPRLSDALTAVRDADAAWLMQSCII